MANERGSRQHDAGVGAMSAAEGGRYRELCERFVEINPDVQGGEPVIRGTRIPIRGLARQIAAGEARDVLLADYDYLDPDAFEFACEWAARNPRPDGPSVRDAFSRTTRPKRRGA
jgi:uncharacterized protein (DUF433 family)